MNNQTISKFDDVFDGSQPTEVRTVKGLNVGDVCVDDETFEEYRVVAMNERSPDSYVITFANGGKRYTSQFGVLARFEVRT